ncbi:MAG: DegT/DnrJ/EryC1/StrS family aminotransferase [Anaerolineae bacterium]|nr:DegT/DnrJ/EryC1/StrS family aminotransferase [Anaerolineae bacterium]
MSEPARPSIPQTDPRANYLAHKAEIDAAIAAVLEGGRYILGQEVAAFEAEFAAYIGVGHAVGVASGTDALELALRAAGIGSGDAVFTVSHTAVATVAAIERRGATPVLVDIDPTTYTMDPNRLEEAIRSVRRSPSSTVPRPAAIIPVHLYGHPADMTAILTIARRYDLVVIEDGAQAHGATWRGRRVGAWGHLAAFSFYPTKNLAALGDGGAVVTDDAGLAERVRLLRQYGWRQRYVSELPGVNSRLDELQAAVLRVKLRHLDRENERRRQIAAAYTRLLADSGLGLPVCRPEAEPVYHQYVVRTPLREALQARLTAAGIGTLVHYPQAVHQQPAYAGRLPLGGPLSHSETAAAQVLSLPMYPELTDEAVRCVAEVIVGRPFDR